MIDADLRGKLRADGSNAHERSEDLLTSTVFGLLRYLPADQGLIPLMRRSRAATLRHGQLMVSQQSPDQSWMSISAAASCEIEFWPSFGKFGQPDLLLTFLDAARRPVHLTVVEAKLHSPKSGEAEDNGEDDAPAADVAEDSWTPDQLVRYWRGMLSHIAASDPNRCSVVYLTAHTTPPTEDLTISLRACPTMRLGWLSWRDVWHTIQPLLNQTEPPLAAVDLERLLANRGFRSLNAFKQEVLSLLPIRGFWQPRDWFQDIIVTGLPPRLRFWGTNLWFEQQPVLVKAASGHFWEEA